MLVFIASFATVGALLAWKRPGNPIGWLLSAIGLAYAVGVFGMLLSHFRRTLTLASWLGWIWLFGIGLGVFVLLLFPTGAPALTPLAAGGLGRRGGPGRVGAGQRIRPQDRHRQPGAGTRWACPGQPGTSSTSWRQAARC